MAVLLASVDHNLMHHLFLYRLIGHAAILGWVPESAIGWYFAVSLSRSFSTQTKMEKVGAIAGPSAPSRFVSSPALLFLGLSFQGLG